MAIFQSLRITGRPILLTTVSIVAGMSVLIFASFKPIIYFGVLVIFALSSTCIGTLVALPAVLALFFQWQQKKKSGTILSPWKQIL
jgi:predicted RND superfamily exporter protein